MVPIRTLCVLFTDKVEQRTDNRVPFPAMQMFSTRKFKVDTSGAVAHTHSLLYVHTHIRHMLFTVPWQEI